MQSLAATAAPTYRNVTIPVFWGISTALLSGVAAATCIPFINSFGNLTGFLAPYIMELVKQATQSTNAGLYGLAALLIIGAALVLIVPTNKRTD